MQHYIAYHNTEKMGRALQDGNPLRLLTSKPVKPLTGNAVWMIVGEGPAKGRRYSLGSVFVVNETGDAPEGGFKHFASGPGHEFRPPVAVGAEDWFKEILRVTSHFSMGVQETKDAAVMAALLQIASKAGYSPA